MSPKMPGIAWLRLDQGTQLKPVKLGDPGALSPLA